jgi:hypothetical protein
LLVVAVVAVMLLPAAALAQDELTASDVVRLSPEMDGEILTFSGETVGDVIRATTGGVWVNVLSGGTALGVWTTAEDAAVITTLGDHKHTGDAVRVTGTFNFACDLHAGDLDIHAQSIELVEPGGPRVLPVEWWKVAAAGVLGLLAAALGILYRRRPHFA